MIKVALYGAILTSNRVYILSKALGEPRSAMTVGKRLLRRRHVHVLSWSFAEHARHGPAMCANG